MTITETGPCRPHGIKRPFTPTVERYEDGTVRIELGYGFELGPNVRAAFVGTPQTVIREYLTPLLNAAMNAAEPETDDMLARIDRVLAEDDVYDIVAAAEIGDPSLNPVTLFAAGWLTAHPAHAVRHQMTLADAMHDQSVNAKLSNFLEANCPRLDGGWRP